ncbi:hypothetical protein ASPFODRAFT_313388 [Aspergillus luchuensis CBS 106.47]|uniref:Uncharacterized protein n=1 Tax=Aspergillus luchuensis (strain CBS 106.47) TaxID=1137211 RepID=A0A1M3T979_ASPLC|nr:hypothetical protein ASPFODRAFT_313388 [Aspergillus luchuensis CBS 106.47]
MALLQCDFWFSFPPTPSLLLVLLLLVVLIVATDQSTLANINRTARLFHFPTPLPWHESHRILHGSIAKRTFHFLHSSLAPPSNCRGGGGSLSHKKGIRVYQYVKWGDNSQSVGPSQNVLIKSSGEVMQRRSSHRIRGFASIAARRGQDQYRNASLDLSFIVPPATLTSATDNAPRRYYNRRYLPPQLQPKVL